MATPKKPRTLYEKIFADHIVAERDDGTVLLYIDRHLIHEVTSPQAFSGLASRSLPVRQPALQLATSDHNVPTTPRPYPVTPATYLRVPASRLQVQTLERNVRAHNIPYLGLNSRRQGIVHVIGPELGFTLPGTTIVCGDSHTSTHGAFGALAWGVGTSEVEHVLATQTVVVTRWGNMRVEVNGALAEGVSSKDLMMHIIGTIGTAGGTGMVIEFAGPVIRKLSMESRMALCNMSIEAGARAGLIAPDETTFEYVKGRPLAPTGGQWEEVLKYWEQLYSDPGAHFDKTVHIDATAVMPTVTWGTSPEQVVSITGSVPAPEDFEDPVKQESCRQALGYMGLEAGARMTDIAVDKVFIGSCTNARLEDFRIAARILRGKRISPNLKLALAVPGSGAVKRAAEREGIDAIFKQAGFQWREAGCSLCVGLNEDALLPFERCASTSNRNFESRQGTAGRTHLVSPAVAAATAIHGTLADVRLETGLKPQEAPEVIYSSESEEYIESGSEGGNPEVENTDQPSAAPVARSAKISAYSTTVCGSVAIVERSNIDTDAIFPKQFCTTIERKGLGDCLFHNLRYHPDGNPKADFILNQKKHRNASFLLATGPNFGCGSSREHAVWALQDFGFRCIFAPSFADIFYNNAFKNGLLLVKPDAALVARIVLSAGLGKEIQINLADQVVLDESGVKIGGFEIEERRKKELIDGMDEIAVTLATIEDIEEFERDRKAARPWIDESVRDGWSSKLAKEVKGWKHKDAQINSLDW
ncbi:uncharacterized protein BDZ99DRAFT_550654 [Mytilinidion resinicola]|uniref:3-isopropylmalate dehydratase n=1 Tax=Mytilinidion resinicola TaxID=574789 RepID=A0A6A6Y1R7_9PEZI|nr:uncharacterized protein BDZ99DRAFT_550654 [Mytilinidion resinicola]KAF2802756.1 hypothetical protein BDZ99DRAFT_550654 [Mytilinidion resinicola]